MGIKAVPQWGHGTERNRTELRSNRIWSSQVDKIMNSKFEGQVKVHGKFVYGKIPIPFRVEKLIGKFPFPF